METCPWPRALGWVPHRLPGRISDEILNVPPVPRVVVLLKRGQISGQPPTVSLWPPQLAVIALGHCLLRQGVGGGVLPQAVFVQNSLHGVAEPAARTASQADSLPHTPSSSASSPKTSFLLSPVFLPKYILGSPHRLHLGFPRSRPAMRLLPQSCMIERRRTPQSTALLGASLFKSLLECAGKKNVSIRKI